MATTTLPLSPAEYLARERKSDVKHEYVDGELRPMTGAGRLHNLILFDIAFVIRQIKSGRKLEAYLNDMRVRIPDGPYYYPDATIAPSPPELEDDVHDTLLNPLVIFEILSPSTATIDQIEKSHNYRQIPSLTDYLIVSQEQLQIEHYSRLSETEWRVSMHNKTDAVVRLQSLEAEFKLADVYSEWLAEQGK